MLPKKIYLNYVNENDVDKTWSEEPISASDCEMNNREYTDLSQVWHDRYDFPKNKNRMILFYDEFNCVFMRMYNQFLEYEPDFHQIHIEEILYKEKVKKK